MAGSVNKSTNTGIRAGLANERATPPGKACAPIAVSSRALVPVGGGGEVK